MMKRSGTISFILTLTFFSLLNIGNTAHAFQKFPHTDERKQHLKELLSLTDDQLKQVDIILKKSGDKANKDKQNAKGSKRVMAKFERTRRAETDKEIEALLTSEQQKKYESYKKARRSETDTRNRPRGEEYN